MDNIINIFGLIGAILVAVSFIPQTYKTINSDEIKDISVLFMSINIVSSGLMCIYGGYFMIIPVIISNGSVLSNCCIILYCVLKNSEQKKGMILPP